MTQLIERPELVFGVFTTNREGIRLANSAFEKFFGKDNFDQFRKATRKGSYIPEETRQRVDREIYHKVGRHFHLSRSLRKREAFWKKAITESNGVINYARGIFFPDQERVATLTNNLVWSDRRPSTILERLTKPKRLVGEELKYEQGRQLGVGWLCAQRMSEDENGYVTETLDRINHFLEGQAFVGREGETQSYPVYSYHAPSTNRLIGLRSQFPDPQYEKSLWVKSLDYSVRNIAIKDPDGNIKEIVPALYDPREKDLYSAVIKGSKKSLLAANGLPNMAPIEISPHVEDLAGFRFVVMGGRPLRDRLTSYLEGLFWLFEGVTDIIPDDQVNPSDKRQHRPEFRRRQIYMDGLRTPIEMMLYALEDWINSEYEVGNFNEELDMHDGPAHDLHKLDMVADVAEFYWPPRVFSIPLAETKKTTSYEYATRLGRKYRIYPSPYTREL